MKKGETKETTHTMTSLVCSKVHTTSKLVQTKKTKRQELSIHVEHAGGEDALPIHVVKVKLLFQIVCLELQSSEFRHHI